MAYATPGNQSPGGAFRSAPYSRKFTGAAVLTTQVSQAPNSATGLLCLVTATTIQLAYKDASGTAVDTGSITSVVGNTFDVPLAVSELTTVTGLVVIAYWHGSGS